jgi:hypothetical protein
MKAEAPLTQTAYGGSAVASARQLRLTYLACMEAWAAGMCISHLEVVQWLTRGHMLYNMFGLIAWKCGLLLWSEVLEWTRKTSTCFVHNKQI